MDKSVHITLPDDGKLVTFRNCPIGKSAVVGNHNKKSEGEFNMIENRFVKITEDEAKNLYCHTENVYVSTNKREYWQLPPSYYYASHASNESLFYRSIPEYEGTVEFFKAVKVTVYPYKVGVGVECVALEYHEINARNMEEARSIAIRKFLHPDKGYNHVEVKRIKK